MIKLHHSYIGSQA